MNFLPTQLKKALPGSPANTLLHLRVDTKNKYQECMQFMKEWEADLLEREHSMNNLQQEVLEAASKQPTQ